MDNRLKFSSPGVISGRNGELKRWLQANCAPLFERYSTVMRYKQLSLKFRQVLGAADPTPASNVLDSEDAAAIFAEAGATCVGLARALDARLDPSRVSPIPFPSDAAMGVNLLEGRRKRWCRRRGPIESRPGRCRGSQSP